MKFRTIKDLKLKDKKVLLRLDLNCDVVNGKIVESDRIKAHSETIKKLLQKKARVIVLAHQGSPGKKDCISLRQHSKILNKYLGKKLKFIPETMGKKSWTAISSMNSGEAILLENVRYLKDEFNPSTKSDFVNFFKEAGIDYYVNDSFSILHRNQTSIVSFPKIMRHAIGPVLLEELKNIKKLKSKMKNCLFVLGGVKSGDLIPLLRNKNILSTGKLSLLILIAKGYNLGKENELLKKELKLIPKIKKYLKNIEVPEDLAINSKGKREDLILEAFPKDFPVFDIGEKTIEMYKRKIANLGRSDAVFIKGAPGMFEHENFASGTKEILKAIANSKAFSVISGGSISDAIKIFKINKKKFGYVSLSGGSLVKYLAGEKLVGLEVLR